MIQDAKRLDRGASRNQINYLWGESPNSVEGKGKHIAFLIPTSSADLDQMLNTTNPSSVSRSKANQDFLGILSLRVCATRRRQIRPSLDFQVYHSPCSAVDVVFEVIYFGSY